MESGGNDIAIALAALLSGGVGAALIAWWRGKDKDEAELVGMVEAVHERVRETLQGELDRTTRLLTDERRARADLETQLLQVSSRLRELEDIVERRKLDRE